jgi:hypothetical protein
VRAFTAATLKRWRHRPRPLLIGLGAVAAVAIGLLLLAVTSGGDGDDGSDAGSIGSEAVAGPSTGDPAALEAGPGTTVVETMADLERVWAEARAEVVAELSSDRYGIGDDNVLRGPGGFEVDLSDCPASWSDNEGVDATTIRIGHPSPLTGTVAFYSQLSTGMEAYFDHVNANGGVDGRQIELITRDNGYQDTRTVEQVDELLTTDQPFLVATLGTPNSLAVYDTLNDQCIPHPFVMNGHPAWGDPEAHPFTTGLQLSSATEALLWASWIEENLADQLPVSVRSLYMENDFGIPYHTSFAEWAEQHPEVISDYEGVSHRQVAPSISEEMATIAADEPDVFLSMTAARPCLLAIQEAGALGLTESAAALFTPSGCRDAEAYLIPAGPLADGWHIVGAGTLPADDPGQTEPGQTDTEHADDTEQTDPDQAGELYLDFVVETLEAAELDTSVELHLSGFAQFGWAHVEALRIAAELPGGLTRSNLVLATHGMTLTHPYYLDGISFSVSGNDDAYFVEGGQFSTFDAADGVWVPDGPPVDLNGATPNCSWSDKGCR